MKLVRHRKSSSVSRRKLRNRRNKSGSRKKYAHTHTHTIKGGCWGKKGGARSRRYRHKRTHKRGKRFHRGGETSMEDIQTRIQNMNLHEGLYRLGNNEFPNSLPRITLTYKKQGPFPPETKEFYLNVIYDTKNNTDRMFTITLRRFPGNQDDPYFEYEGTEYLTNSLKKEKDSNRFYNFSYPENTDKFYKITAAVNNFIQSLTQVPSSSPADNYRD